MAIENTITTPQQKDEDKTLDLTLRPSSLVDYVGQKSVKRNLHILMEAARQRSEPIEHILLYGPPGLGKTTLAHIIAKEMKANIRMTSGPAIERAGDIAAILTNLQEGDILFIDEIHRLHRVVEEMLYPAMEDFALDIIVGKGPAARILRLNLPRFTIIGATTRISAMSSPLRDRFGAHYKLDFYEEEEVEDIVHRAAKILSISIDNPSAKEVARRARRTPRIANRLLKRVRDYAQIHNDNVVTLTIAQEALALLDVDILGLNVVDRKLLLTIIEKFSGGPVGLQTLAAATAEEQETIEEVYEPFLIQLGFLMRTPRGRVTTEHAYRHLGFALPPNLQQRML